MTAVATNIPFRLRTDLRWVFYPHSNHPHWVANDPVQQEFYFVSELERRVASKLNGNATVESILESERDAVANGVLTRDSVVQLVTRLNQNSLLLATNSSITNHRESSASQSSFSVRYALQLLGSILALRIPILNPTALLQVTAPLGRMLFRLTTFYFVSLLVVVAIAIASLNWSSLLQDATRFNSNLHGDRLWITLGLLISIKLLHELGHGMACVRFGGKCNEFGLILLFGMPSLYCDVTDSWRLPNRWQRMIIAAGGIYVELILATLACFVWISSDTIGFRGMAVQLMIVCSLMTLLLNANPLLRYDGYYILSDWIGIPNLGEECRKAWTASWISFFTINPSSKIIAIESRSGYARWLITYHILSFIYRCLLLSTIVLLAYNWLEQSGMRSVAVAILYGALGLTSFIVIEKLRSGVILLLQTGRVHWRRFGFVAALIMVAVCVAAFVPLPTSIIARGYVEPNNMLQLFSRCDAVLIQSATDGQVIDPRESLFQLESYDLNRDILKTEGEIEVALMRIKQLENRLTTDPDSPQQIIETERKLIGLRNRFQDLKSERDSLTITVDRPGVFLDPYRSLHQRDFTSKSKLPRINLQAKLLDRAHAERGELLGYIGDRDKWLVNALITEEALQNVFLGDRAWVRIDRYPSKTFEGSVKSISADSVSRTPEALAGDSLFNSYKPSAEESLPEETTFNVSIEVDRLNDEAKAFGLASVKIETKSRTIISQFYDRILSRFLLAR
jgi:putative peptide zinc metalloprotease protein